MSLPISNEMVVNSDKTTTSGEKSISNVNPNNTIIKLETTAENVGTSDEVLNGPKKLNSEDKQNEESTDQVTQSLMKVSDDVESTEKNKSSENVVDKPVLQDPDCIEDRFRVDRKNLEQMLQAGAKGKGQTGEKFFNDIMEKTGAKIAWPSKIKIGAKSKKDPHVKVSGKQEAVLLAKQLIQQVLDTKSTRVTLKMDVAHTEHSHIIGKGGSNVRKVMEETGCHIHFPDSNRNSNNNNDKSNQVSIAGQPAGVENARGKIRALLPVVISFDITPSTQIPDPNQPNIQRIVQMFGVGVIFKQRPKTYCTTTCTVRGSTDNLGRLIEGTRKLMQHLTGSTLLHVTSYIEVAPQQHSYMVGRNATNINLIIKHTGAQIRFPDQNSMVQCPRKSIIISGQVESVVVARQQLMGCLPLVLMFDVKNDDEISSVRENERNNSLMEELDVFISVKQKNKHSNKSVIVKSVERNVQSMFEARKRMLGLQTTGLVGGVNQMMAPPNTTPIIRISDPSPQYFGIVHANGVLLNGVTANHPALQRSTSLIQQVAAPLTIPSTTNVWSNQLAGLQNNNVVHPNQQQGAGIHQQLVLRTTEQLKQHQIMMAPTSPNIHINPLITTNVQPISPTRNQVFTPITMNQQWGLEKGTASQQAESELQKSVPVKSKVDSQENKKALTLTNSLNHQESTSNKNSELSASESVKVAAETMFAKQLLASQKNGVFPIGNENYNSFVKKRSPIFKHSSTMSPLDLNDEGLRNALVSKVNSNNNFNGQANLPNLVQDSKNCPFQVSKVESIETTNYLNNVSTLQVPKCESGADSSSSSNDLHNSLINFQHRSIPRKQVSQQSLNNINGGISIKDLQQSTSMLASPSTSFSSSVNQLRSNQNFNSNSNYFFKNKMNSSINVLSANDKMRELFDDRQSTAAPPGFENVQIKHDHPLMNSHDYEWVRQRAMELMKKEPIASKVRTPTDQWSGLGFSQSMPNPKYKINKFNAGELPTTFEGDDEVGDTSSKINTRVNCQQEILMAQASNGIKNTSAFNSWREKNQHNSIFSQSFNIHSKNVQTKILPNFEGSANLASSSIINANNRSSKSLNNQLNEANNLNHHSGSQQVNLSDVLIYLNLEKYVKVFTSQEVDLQTFLTLNDSDLTELGINTFGPRKKILLAIEELNKHRSSVISSSFPNIDTVNSMVTSSVRPGKNLSTNLLDGFLVNNKLTSSVPLTTSNDYSKQNNSIIMSSKNELTSGSSTVLNYNRGSLASQSGRW